MSKYNNEYYIVVKPYGEGHLYVKADGKTCSRNYENEKIPFGQAPLFFHNMFLEDDLNRGIKRKITDALIVGASLLVKDHIRDALKYFEIDGMQFYPAIYIDDEENWHDDFWYMNFYNEFDYLDKEKSVFDSYVDYDDKEVDFDEALDVDIYCLNESMLDNVPEQQRLMFRMTNLIDPYLFVHDKIVKYFTDNNIEGVRFIKVADFREGCQYRKPEGWVEKTKIVNSQQKQPKKKEKILKEEIKFQITYEVKDTKHTINAETVNIEDCYVKKMGDQYYIEDPNVKDTPTKEEFQHAVNMFNKEFDKFSIRSQFRDSSAIVLLDDANDEPTYILGAEISSDNAVSMRTIQFILSLMKQISPKFKLFLTFEYNYIGYNFICYFDNESVKFCINDKISHKKFGIKNSKVTKIENSNFTFTVDYDKNDIQVVFHDESAKTYAEVLEQIIDYFKNIEYAYSINLQFKFKTEKPYLEGDLPQISANQFFCEAVKHQSLHQKLTQFFNLVSRKEYWYDELEDDSTGIGMFVSAALALSHKRYLYILSEWLEVLDSEHHETHCNIMSVLYDKYQNDMPEKAMQCFFNVIDSHHFPQEVKDKIIANEEHTKLYLKVVSDNEHAVYNDYVYYIEELFKYYPEEDCHKYLELYEEKFKEDEDEEDEDDDIEVDIERTKTFDEEVLENVDTEIKSLYEKIFKLYKEASTLRWRETRRSFEDSRPGLIGAANRHMSELEKLAIEMEEHYHKNDCLEVSYLTFISLSFLLREKVQNKFKDEAIPIFNKTLAVFKKYQHEGGFVGRYIMALYNNTDYFLNYDFVSELKLQIAEVNDIIHTATIAPRYRVMYLHVLIKLELYYLRSGKLDKAIDQLDELECYVSYYKDTDFDFVGSDVRHEYSTNLYFEVFDTCLKLKEHTIAAIVVEKLKNVWLMNPNKVKNFRFINAAGDLAKIVYNTATEIQDEEGLQRKYFDYSSQFIRFIKNYYYEGKDTPVIYNKYIHLSLNHLLNHCLIAAFNVKEIKKGVAIADYIQDFSEINNFVYHSAACLYVADNQYDKAIRQVELAKETNFKYMDRIKNDIDLEPLFNNERFKKVFE